MSPRDLLRIRELASRLERPASPTLLADLAAVPELLRELCETVERHFGAEDRALARELRRSEVRPHDVGRTVVIDCRQCMGTGQVTVVAPCRACDGRGWLAR